MISLVGWPKLVKFFFFFFLVGDQRHLVSIALQKEADATLIRTKQGSMLLPNACVMGAIK